MIFIKSTNDVRIKFSPSEQRRCRQYQHIYRFASVFGFVNLEIFQHPHDVGSCSRKVLFKVRATISPNSKMVTSFKISAS